MVPFGDKIRSCCVDLPDVRRAEGKPPLVKSSFKRDLSELLLFDVDDQASAANIIVLGEADHT
jgi:hypothetical protein